MTFLNDVLNKDYNDFVLTYYNDFPLTFTEWEAATAQYRQYTLKASCTVSFPKWLCKTERLHTIESLPDVGWVVYSYAARLRGELGL